MFLFAAFVVAIFNPRHACAARVTVLGLCVCLSVCVCCSFSATVRNKVAKKRYQQFQHYTGLILNMAIFIKILRSKVMVWNMSEKADMQMTLSSPLTAFAHFQNQRSKATTWWTTGEPYVVLRGWLQWGTDHSWQWRKIHTQEWHTPIIIPFTHSRCVQ